MRLHQSPFAPNARRVRMFLAEKGIEIPFNFIDLAKLDQKSEAYGAVNAFQLIPALELDDGSVIAESISPRALRRLSSLSSPRNWARAFK